MNIKPLLVLLMFSGVLYPAIWMSGDAGEAWSKDKAEEMCARSDVAAVYICLGNTVSVLWKDESKGTTFYEPEGTVVNCPPVAPTDMGAECMQLMMPNYCTTDDNVCGDVAPEEFPGGETEGEIIYNGVPVQEEEVEEEQPPAEEEETPPTEENGGVVSTGPRVVSSRTPTMEGALDNMVLVVAVLAVIVIALLYLVFRRTTGGR